MSFQRFLPAVLAGLCIATGLLLPPASQAQWYIDNRASTPGESYARGMADVISAKGDYNLQTSQAAINAEHALSQDIDNRAKWTQTYFDMRKMNNAYRAEERGKRPSEEDLVRYAQQGKPKRLSPSELDFVTGKISWPKYLQLPQFAGQRKSLEELFRQRSTYSGLGFEEQLQVRNATGMMIADLKRQIQQIPSSDYLMSKRFLESLQYEAQLPTS